MNETMVFEEGEVRAVPLTKRGEVIRDYEDRLEALEALVAEFLAWSGGVSNLPSGQQALMAWIGDFGMTKRISAGTQKDLFDILTADRGAEYGQFREWAIAVGAEFPMTVENLNAWIREFGWVHGQPIDHLLEDED